MHARHSLSVAALLLGVGCSEPNPYYDPNAAGVDAATDATTQECTTSETCPSPAPVCVERTCVQCDATHADACSGVTPICNVVSNTCEGCSANADCASTACRPDGACAAEADVAYVKLGGGSGPCTRAAPCATLRQGLATTKPVIKIEGVAELSETAVTMIARDAIILADAGALMRRSNSGPILRVTDDLTVSISGLGLGGTAGGITDAALVASNPTELALHHVFITGNSQVGLKVTGGKLVMDGCIVVGNVNGGLDADATMLDITSSMFVSNGQTGSVTAFGAVQAANVQAGSRFAFNTIAGNTANVAKTDGIACSTALEIVSTIVHDDVTSGACTYSKSLVPPATACTGCVTGDPKFASTNVSDPRAADFFRLKPGSPAIAAGAPVAGIHLDIDGDPRPTTTPDIGADQYTP